MRVRDGVFECSSVCRNNRRKFSTVDLSMASDRDDVSSSQSPSLQSLPSMAITSLSMATQSLLCVILFMSVCSFLVRSTGRIIDPA